MEPNVKTAFEEILKRLDSIDERCGRWEKTAADSEQERKEQGAAMEHLVAHLEEAMSAQAKNSADQIRGLEELGSAIDDRVGMLERFCGEQSHTAIVADNWGREIEQRIEDVEYRMGDLELIQLRELHGDGGDRLATLEVAVAAIEEWRPYFEGTLDDVQLEVRRLKRGGDRTPLGIATAPPGAEISPEHAPDHQAWDRTPLGTAMAQPGARYSQPGGLVVSNSSAADENHV